MTAKRQSVFEFHREMFAAANVADALVGEREGRASPDRIRGSATGPRRQQTIPPPGMSVVKIYRDSRTGFSAVALRRDDGSDMVFAIAQATISPDDVPESVKDVFDALREGEKQYQSGAAQDMIDDAFAAVQDSHKVTITGHSLGGLLAQRVTYEVGRRQIESEDRGPSSTRGQVSGVTFGAVGGAVSRDGQINGSQIDTNVTSAAPVTNYLFKNDFAPRLNEAGHLGDLMIISDRDLDARTRSASLVLHQRASYEKALRQNPHLLREAEAHVEVPPPDLPTSHPDLRNPARTPTLSERSDSGASVLAQRKDFRPRRSSARARSEANQPAAAAAAAATPGVALDLIRRADGAETAVRTLQHALNEIMPRGPSGGELPLHVDGQLGPVTGRRFREAVDRDGPERLAGAIGRRGGLFGGDIAQQQLR